MKIKKAFLVLLVIIFAVCPAITSCQKEDDRNTASKRVENKTDKYGRPYIEDNVPDDLDFGGETVTILVREGELYTQEFGVEETTGSILNDSLYNRNRVVEEALNIKIKTLVQTTSTGTYPPFDFNDKVRANILSGSNDFDILASYGYYGVTLANEGLFRNLLDIPHLDLSKPWWNQSFMNEMNIKNQLYFVIGDASFTSIDFTFATFYNKNLAKEWYPGIDFYKVVDDGDWTLDYFHQLIKDTYVDKDGSGDKSDNDFYAIGMATASTPLDPLFAAADIPITTKNSEGIPEFTFKTERTTTFFDKMYELLFNNKGVLPGKYTGDSIIQMQKKFKNQETVFNIDRLSDAIKMLTDADFEYGMLPIPKLDKEQSSYYTCASDAYSMLSIPITEPEDKLAMVGATLELLAAESYRSVTPAYFEVIMKYRYLTTDEDARMYDKVLAGVRYNFGVVYSYSLNDIQHIVRDILDARSKDFVSTYEKTIEKAQYDLEQLLIFYEEQKKE
jgi:hypothetical protein